MFSGIIEERGRVKKILKNPEDFRLVVESDIVSKDSKIGDSISVNGVCLTVFRAKGRELSFDVMEETLKKTSLSKISIGDVVNLERALKFGDIISGHFVTGHVDCVGKVIDVIKSPNNYAMDIEFPEDKAPYVAEKGSISIDGVSLTVAEVKENVLRVFLIPLTLEATNLGSKKMGNSVNIEFDILSKYVLKKSENQRKKIDMDFLKKHGFL